MSAGVDIWVGEVPAATTNPVPVRPVRACFCVDIYNSVQINT